MGDSDKSDSSSASVSGGGGMFFFFIATTIYAVVKFNIDPNENLIATLCYIITVVVGEFLINMNMTTSICKHQNWKLAFIITVVPWVLMFGIIMLMLFLYPGWKAPFSNTLGYGIARLAGSKTIMEKIFPVNPNDEGDGASPDTKEISQSLAYIYTDQSILMNEVTMENFDKFWTSTAPIRSATTKDGSEVAGKLKNSFKKLIQLKEIVGEYVWYMLTGSLVVSVGYNYLITASCEPTIAQTKKAAEEAKNKNKQSDES